MCCPSCTPNFTTASLVQSTAKLCATEAENADVFVHHQLALSQFVNKTIQESKFGVQIDPIGNKMKIQEE